VGVTLGQSGGDLRATSQFVAHVGADHKWQVTYAIMWRQGSLLTYCTIDRRLGYACIRNQFESFLWN
jgi:hypothetical protein